MNEESNQIIPTTSIDPQNNTINIGEYIYRPPSNPYYNFLDLCKEIESRNLNPVVKTINELEQTFNITVNKYERDNYADIILEIANGNVEKYLNTNDRVILDFIGVYYTIKINDYNKAIRYEIKSAKLGYSDAFNNIKHLLNNINQYDLLFKWLVMNDCISYSESWFDSFEIYYIWRKELNSAEEYRQPMLYAIMKTWPKSQSYVRNTMNKYLADYPEHNYEELAAMFININGQEYKDRIPFETLVIKIQKGKMAYRTLGDCPVCREDNVDVIPVSWSCIHKICVRCHNNIYLQNKCPLCRCDLY